MLGPARRRSLLLTLVACVAVSAVPVAAQSPATCGPLAAAPLGDPAQPAAHLTIFAAASLRDAFEALAPAWNAAHPGSELVFSFDASSALRAQIEEGAPADVLASADERNAQTLVDECLAPGPITPFAYNELVIVVPAGNPAGIESAADLATSGVRVVTALPDVPITRYTTQLLATLAGLEGYPDGFAQAVTANTVSEEENVRAILTRIELGEGDAALVYVTDALSSAAVEMVPLPDEADVLATYAALGAGTTSQPALAAAFLEFLVGPEAQAILAAHGFVTLSDAARASPPA